MAEKTKEVKSNELQLYWLNKEREKQGLPPIYVDFEDFESANLFLPVLQQEYLNQLRGEERMPGMTPEELMFYERMQPNMPEGGVPSISPGPMQLPPMPGLSGGGGGQGQPTEYQDALMALQRHGLPVRPDLVEMYVQNVGTVDAGQLWAILEKASKLKPRDALNQQGQQTTGPVGSQ